MSDDAKVNSLSDITADRKGLGGTVSFLGKTTKYRTSAFFQIYKILWFCPES
jgi:hypothetical protein